MSKWLAVVTLVLVGCSSPGETVIIQQAPAPTPSATPDGAPQDSGGIADASLEDAADAADAAPAPKCEPGSPPDAGTYCFSGKPYSCLGGAVPFPGCKEAPPNDAGELVTGAYCCP